VADVVASADFGQCFPASLRARADEPPTWVLIDCQGIGHERTASTKIDRIVPPELATKFSAADVICLVDRSAPFALLADHTGDVNAAEVSSRCVYPNDPKRRLEVWWSDVDKRKDLYLIAINGSSTWTGPGGFRKAKS
jgi:hypothetical protein